MLSATRLPLVFLALHLAVLPSAGGPADPVETPAKAPAKRFHMRVENWAWVPNTLRVTLGTEVTLEIEGLDANHRFDLKEYGLAVKVPQGETTRVEFVADKAGTFTWKCGRPCGDGCPRMRGKLTVVDPHAQD